MGVLADATLPLTTRAQSAAVLTVYLLPADVNQPVLHHAASCLPHRQLACMQLAGCMFVPLMPAVHPQGPASRGDQVFGRKESAHTDHVDGDSGMMFGVPRLVEIAETAANRPKGPLKERANDAKVGGMLEQVGHGWCPQQTSPWLCNEECSQRCCHVQAVARVTKVLDAGALAHLHSLAQLPAPKAAFQPASHLNGTFLVRLLSLHVTCLCSKLPRSLCFSSVCGRRRCGPAAAIAGPGIGGWEAVHVQQGWQEARRSRRGAVQRTGMPQVYVGAAEHPRCSMASHSQNAVHAGF